LRIAWTCFEIIGVSSGGTTLGIWKATIHLGGLKPSGTLCVAFGGTPQDCHVGPSSPPWSFPRVFPRAWCPCEPETHPAEWGCGVSLTRSRPSSLLHCLSEHLCGVWCGYRCHSTYHKIHRASTRRVIRQPNRQSQAKYN
jgi:hypothetical protein